MRIALSLLFLVIGFPCFDWGFSQETATSSVQALSPDKERSLLARATDLFYLKDYLGARTAAEEFLLRYPKSAHLPAVYLLLGRAGQALDRKKAILALETLLKQFPSDPLATPARVELGKAYLAIHAPDKAITLWQNVEGETAEKISVYDQAAQLEETTHPKRAIHALKLMHDLLLDIDKREALKERVRLILTERLEEADIREVIEAYRPMFPADEAAIALIALLDSKEEYDREMQVLETFVPLFPHHPYAKTIPEALADLQDKIKAQKFLIAAIFPQSGKASTFGVAALNGVRLAIGQWRGSRPEASIGLIVSDENKGNIQMERWLKEYRPVGIVGPLLSKQVNRIGAIAKRLKLFLITPAATSASLVSLGESVIRHAMTPRSQCLAMVAYAAKKMRAIRYAVLYPDDPMGWLTCFSETIEQSGGVLVHAESYVKGTTDFRQAISRLKPAGDGSGALQLGFDVLLLPGEAKDIRLIAPQLKFYGIQKIPLLGSHHWGNPEVLASVADDVDGAVYVSGFFPQSHKPYVQDFVEAYKTQFHMEPDLFAAQAYDATTLILTAMDTGKDITPQAVRDAIGRMRDVPGITGDLSGVRHGEAIRSPIFVEIVNGKHIQTSFIHTNR